MCATSWSSTPPTLAMLHLANTPGSQYSRAWTSTPRVPMPGFSRGWSAQRALRRYGLAATARRREASSWSWGVKVVVIIVGFYILHVTVSTQYQNLRQIRVQGESVAGMLGLDPGESFFR